MSSEIVPALAVPTPSALRLTDVEIRYPLPDGAREAVVVDRLSLRIDRGESVGVLGESGSGKTSLALGATGLLPATARYTGAVEIDGREIPESAGERFWRRLRGDTVGIVFQQPNLALHPLRRVGSQIVDVLRAHRPWPKKRCRTKALELLVELDLSAETYYAFPHQLSGGQRQRIVFAQAVACEPTLLVADEPTTALDHGTEARVLALVDRLRRRKKMSMLWISHDPAVLAEVTDRLYVIYGGKWMEEGPTAAVLNNPLHPYTRALLACRPCHGADDSLCRPLTVDPSGKNLPETPEPSKTRPTETLPTRTLSSKTLSERRLPVIPGHAPAPGQRSTGCRFADRCRHVAEACSQPPVAVSRADRQVWCIDPEPREPL